MASAGPDPRRIRNLEDLAAEFALLLIRAAPGTGRAKVSLAELARRLGLPSSSKSSMHSYVTGKTLVPAEVLDAMVIALGASPVEQREWSEAWFRVAASRQRARRTTIPRPRLDKVPSVPATDFAGRAWAFERIASWLAGADPILLITGEPGAGKSTLIGNLISITHGESPPYGPLGLGFLAATHFCRQQVAESLDATAVIRQLVLQLCRTVPGFADALWQGDPKPATADGEAELAAILHTESVPRQAYDKYIRQPLRLLASGPNPPAAVVVAVDGLDEAVEGGAGFRLVTTLARESQLTTPKLWLLLTSRPGRAIRHLTAASRFDLIDDEPEVGEDVRDYIEGRLRARSVPAASVLARRISATGRGNFLYARFVVDDLLTCPGLITLANVRLPDGLVGLYREFLDREIAAVEPEWRQCHRPLLGLLAEARGEGLTVEQLTLLTGLPRSTVADSIALCAPYLRDSPGSGAHRLFHQSFRDYLRASGPHHVYPDEANARIVRELDRALAAGATDPFGTYAVRHLLRHLADPTDREEDKRAVLDRALGHVPFVSAKAAADGVDTLVTEAEQAAAVCGMPTGRAARLLTTLKHQAYNLRTWRPDQHPDLLVQQLHYEATKAGFDDVLVTLDAHVADQPVCRLRVAWSSATSRAAEPEALVDKGHGDTISAAAVSPDGRFVVTGSYDHTVRVWDENGVVRRVLRHPGPIQAVLALPDGRGVGSTCEDHIVYLWSLTPDGPDRRLRHADVVGPMVVTPDGRLVSGCHDGIATVWQSDRAAVQHTFVHDDRVRAIALLTDGRRAVTGSDDHTAYVWDLDTGALLAHLDHDEPVRLLSHTPDGEHVVTLSGDTRLTCWHLSSRTRRYQLDAPGPVRKLTAVGKRHLLVACGRDVLRWDLRLGTSEPVASHNELINAFTVRGTTLITAGRDSTARIWTIGDPRPRHVLRHEDWVTEVVPAPGDQVITASDDRTACRWRIGDGTLLQRLDGDADSVRTVAIAPRGDVVVSGSDDHTVRVRESGSGRLRHTFRHRERVRAVAVSADGGVAISCSDDGTACLWDLETGTARYVLIHDAPVRGLALAPQGKRIITGADDHLIRIWHSDTGRLEHVLSGHTDVVRSVTTTPDAERIVTGSRDGTAMIWTPACSEPLHVLPHGEWVRDVAITNDQQHVLTTCRDALVRVWNLTDGRLTAELAGHRAAVRDVHLSQDARLAVTASMDRTVGVWDLRRRRNLYRLPHDSGVRSVRITPDGGYAISTSDDRTARVWDLTTGTELHRIAAAHRIACCAIDPTDPTYFALGTSSGEVLRVGARTRHTTT